MTAKSQTMTAKSKVYRKRGGRVLDYDPWNFDAEVGDFMIDTVGRLYRLEESRGRDKAMSGDLTPRRIKPPHPTATATCGTDGLIRWCWLEEKE